MGLKILIKIKLPYIIRMEEDKKITARLKPTDEFPQFDVTFYPNSRIYESLYNSNYPNNNCLFIEVEAVTKLYSFKNHEIKCISDHYPTYEVSEKDSKLILNLLRTKLNEYLEILGVRTKMFWITDLSIDPLSNTIGKASQFVYLHPNQATTDYQFSEGGWKNYQTEIENEGKPIISIDESIINECENLVVLGYPWRDYVAKAKIALFESEFNDCIIYCSIAAESFIKQVTAPSLYGLEKDIVLKRLIKAGNNKIIDSYYNVILKHMLGKSLKEVNQELYHSMDSMYKFRNALMHTGEIDRKAFKKAGYEGKEILDFDICKYMLENLQGSITAVLSMITKVNKALQY